MKNLDKSDGALDFAKKNLAKVDYTKLNEKLSLPKASIKSVKPVQLYSSVNEFWGIEQVEWNFIQRVQRTDAIECYAALNVRALSGNKFEIGSELLNKFYCFEGDKKFQGTGLF